MKITVRFAVAILAGIAVVSLLAYMIANGKNDPQNKAERLAKSKCILSEPITGMTIVADADTATCDKAATEAADSLTLHRVASIPDGLTVACVMTSKDGVMLAILAKPDGIVGPYACAGASESPGAHDEPAVKPLLQALLPKAST